MKICKIENCNKEIKCKNLCHNHYNLEHYKKYSEKYRTYERTPNRRYKRHVAFCKRENIPFAISFEKWVSLIENNECYYCHSSLPTNGIALDRKYPDVGYFIDNVVPCCTNCNLTKGDRYRYFEFKIMMDALNEFRKTIQINK